jgi:predicted metal-dependent phosphoesterase TrpH
MIRAEESKGGSEPSMRQEEPQSRVYQLSRFILEEEQGTYIEVPFEMPVGTEELHVQMEIAAAGNHKAVIDLGATDPFRVRGWSGGARNEYTIGTEKATPGYLPGPLTPGKWTVLLGAYRVPAGGCTVKLRVECRLEYARWLKGDLHTHSVHSDGTYTLEEKIAIMEELGCDFLALTDHNTTSQNFARPRNTDLVLIPGMEFTTNSGHCNFLGADDPLEDFRVRNMDDIHRMIATARSRGAKIVLNHPHCSKTGWLWDFDFDYDWVEVWNGPWRPDNQKSLEWWQSELASGRRLVAVGGSDVHRPHPYVQHAMPTTFVYSRSKTVRGILEAISQGHVFMSFTPYAPMLDLTCGNRMLGDLVPAADQGPLTLTAENLQAGDQVKVYSERGLEFESTIGDEVRWSLLIPVGGRRFYRTEVWRYFGEVDKMLLAALSNPIYFESA